MSGSITLEFKNLPLVEAAVRASFKTLTPLSFSIVENVRERIKPEYPQWSQPKEFQIPPGVGKAEWEMGPSVISGVEFGGHPEGLSITLQGQLAIARWRQKTESDPPDYPRFAAMRDALWKVVSAFRDATSQSSAQVVTVNMSYINFLNAPDPSSVLEDYFSKHLHVGAVSGAKQLHKVEFSWREEDEVDVRYYLEKVNSVERDQSLSGYRLGTVAGIRSENGIPDPSKALEIVHDRLQTFFKDAISKRAKQEWQLK